MCVKKQTSFVAGLEDFNDFICNTVDGRNPAPGFRPGVARYWKSCAGPMRVLRQIRLIVVFCFWQGKQDEKEKSE